MATHRVTKSTVAKCPYCPWSKLIFGITKWELQLQSAREVVSHCVTFKLPSKMLALLVILTMIAGPLAAQPQPASESLKVVSFRQVHGREAYPYDSSCAVVAENERMRVTGLLVTGFAGGTSSCYPISIGGRATINNPGDVTLWINNRPYNIMAAVAKGK